MEIWKDVVGFDGYYQVSSLGRVKSLERVIFRKDNVRVVIKPKYLQSVSPDFWYVKVVLFRNNKGKSILIHRLVAEHFIPNPNNYPDINHINGIKSDNRVENLEWCTAKGNARHAYNNGLIKVKVNREMFFQIKTQSDQLTAKQLAKKFGIGYSTVRKIQENKYWRKFDI